ncbi:MAG: hypothetical protein GF330_06315 [Candidatus Eisenbacteria bacterium]|nr:hypothetical protein [Candidatus Eisenbacteria bacterium]
MAVERSRPAIEVRAQDERAESVPIDLRRGRVELRAAEEELQALWGALQEAMRPAEEIFRERAMGDGAERTPKGMVREMHPSLPYVAAPRESLAARLTRATAALERIAAARRAVEPAERDGGAPAGMPAGGVADTDDDASLPPPERIWLAIGEGWYRLWQERLVDPARADDAQEAARAALSAYERVLEIASQSSGDRAGDGPYGRPGESAYGRPGESAYGRPGRSDADVRGIRQQAQGRLATLRLHLEMASPAAAPARSGQE